MRLSLKRGVFHLGFLVSVITALLLVPVRYDATDAEFVTSEICGRAGCTASPGMDCWALPDQEEPIHGACDMRDCPSSWPPREE